MGELQVSRWRRYGHDRLYVKDEQGEQVGWYDLPSGQPHVAIADREADFHRAVRHWLQTHESEPPAAPRRDEDPDAPARADEAEQSMPPRSVAAVEGQGNTLDLAERRTGELARQQATELRDKAPVRTLLGRIVGAHTDERAWRLGAKGEERVGTKLDTLVRKDERWRVLHSIAVGSQGADIDHLVVGPAGVFTLNAKHHPRAGVWVGGDVLMVNGLRQPYVRNSRHEASRASRLLSSEVGLPVHVRGIVVLVGVRDLTIKSGPEDVAVVYREGLVRWLRRQPEVLDEAMVERVFAAARRPSTWTPS